MTSKWPVDPTSRTWGKSNRRVERHWLNMRALPLSIHQPLWTVLFLCVSRLLDGVSAFRDTSSHHPCHILQAWEPLLYGLVGKKWKAAGTKLPAKWGYPLTIPQTHGAAYAMGQ